VNDSDRQLTCSCHLFYLVLFPLSYAWASEWEVDFDRTREMDKDGWRYAVSFVSAWRGERGKGCVVRRRMWKRLAKRIDEE
jgi:hypothetical protein